MSQSEQANRDNLDVFVIFQKAEKYGKVLLNINVLLRELGILPAAEVDDINSLKYIGLSGILRASHRPLDPNLSKPHWPAHNHSCEQKIAPGEIVELEIGIWPAAVRFEAGEKLVFRVAAHSMILADFPPLRGQFKAGDKGRNVLHFGGECGSQLVVPFIPGN